MKNLNLRTKEIAMFLIQNNTTVRDVAKYFSISKSTVHYDLTKRLPKIDMYLYLQVRQILNINLKERSYRGGLATKNKYNTKNS